MTELNQVNSEFADVAAKQLLALSAHWRDSAGAHAAGKIPANEYAAYMTAGASIIGALIIADAIQQAARQNKSAAGEACRARSSHIKKSTA